MFKKIFDLDPNEVETFIKDLVKERYKKGLEPEEYEQWLKDYELEVRWHPTCDEFYVQIEPKITTEDYKHWYFHSDKELTAGEYFKLAFGHEHFYFGEIYGLMTGNTTCYATYGCCGPNHAGYLFIINKEYVSIKKVKTSNNYFIQTYDEKKGREVLKLIESISEEVAVELAIKDYEKGKD